ncbi:MAG: hypothetical protein HKN26_04170, partial [Acidimicrobiales bacterium]|nr:hypothetical protein [Acidimicrobiales bacterium]
GEDATPLLTADESILGTAPMPAWRGTAIAEIQAFSADGALDLTVPHPVGDIPSLLQLGFRVTENLVHGFDIAHALGLEYTIADDLADYALDVWQPHTNLLEASEHFGPTQPVAEDAPAPDRLLALMGRRPA